ncbi:MAG: exo-beta-N-acetylmuramidase NamZ domain-containing protein [Pseudobdellovibrionaceae bacterium]
MFKFGIDVLLSDQKRLNDLKGKRVSLVAHPASVTSKLTHTLDALMQVGSFKLASAFGPQHGMKGEKQYNMVESEDYLDPVYHIPVFSLYGEVRRPTEEMMQTFDIVLFDLQDIGTRIYTYLTTLVYMMEACEKYQKRLIVLDRPNPVGRPIEGYLLKAGFESFVGVGQIPIRHGMTLGEFAKFYQSEKKIKLDLEVISMENYHPESSGFGWPTDRSWVNPSPNAASLNMARCFPGTVMIEGTHLSEGRGTTRPLEVIGAPNLPVEKIIGQMHETYRDWLNGCVIRPCFFQPTFYKFNSELCQGIQIHADDHQYQHQHFKPFRVVSAFLKSLRQVDPEYKIWRDFSYEYVTDRLAIDVITGSDEFRTWVDSPNSGKNDLEKILIQDELNWREKTEKYHLY